LNIGSVEFLLKLRDQASKQLDDIRGKLEGMSKETVANMKRAGIALTAFGVAGALAVRKVVMASGEFEMTTTAFTTLLGSAEKAKDMLMDLGEFAAKTPFTITGVEAAARQLMAVGFEAENILPTLKSLGDVAAGLGMDETGMQRLILNLGQVQTQGKLTGRELRDFLVAGVPLVDELAKHFGKTKAEIADMVKKGLVGSKDVLKAFKNMSSEGGKFYDMMRKGSETLPGMISNVKDSMELLSRTMGEVLLPYAKVLAEMMATLLEWFEEHPTIAKFATVVVVAATALALVVGVGLTMAALWPTVSAAWITFTGAITAATAASLAFLAAWGPIALLAAAIAAGIYGTVKAVQSLTKETKDLGDPIYDIGIGFDNVGMAVDGVIEKVLDLRDILLPGEKEINEQLQEEKGHLRDLQMEKSTMARVDGEEYESYRIRQNNVIALIEFQKDKIKSLQNQKEIEYTSFRELVEGELKLRKDQREAIELVGTTTGEQIDFIVSKIIEQENKMKDYQISIEDTGKEWGALKTYIEANPIQQKIYQQTITSFGPLRGMGIWGDFISRPGQPPIPFSPQDTIVGVKEGKGESVISKVGGMTINIENINAGNQEEVDDLFERMDEWQGRILADKVRF